MLSITKKQNKTKLNKQKNDTDEFTDITRNKKPC